MFGLFGPNPTEDEVVRHCRKLVDLARIDPLRQRGRQVRFIIRVPCAAATLRSHFRHAHASTMFLLLIDARIQQRLYEPTSAMLEYGRWPEPDDGSQHAPRFVKSRLGMTVMQWKTGIS